MPRIWSFAHRVWMALVAPAFAGSFGVAPSRAQAMRSAGGARDLVADFVIGTGSFVDRADMNSSNCGCEAIAWDVKRKVYRVPIRAIPC